MIGNINNQVMRNRKLILLVNNVNTLDIYDFMIFKNEGTISK